MKTLLLILSFVGISTLSLAQQRIAYSYDSAGNRITRTVLTMRSATQSLENDSIAEKIEAEGISRNLSECKVTVYPNPTQGELKISITNGEEDAIAEITVYSNSGQFLKTLKAEGNTVVPIDLTPYPSGIYLIDFRQGESRSYYKIIKQ